MGPPRRLVKAKAAARAAAAAHQSHKTRRKLQKIELNRNLKVDRKKLLNGLKSCQLQPNQLDLFHSTSSMQTKGLKRFLGEDGKQTLAKLKEVDRAEQNLDAVALLTRRKRRKGASKQNGKSGSYSSSSEDTDDVSTDTELYYDEPQVKEEDEEENIATVTPPPDQQENQQSLSAASDSSPKTIPQTNVGTNSSSPVIEQQPSPVRDEVCPKNLEPQQTVVREPAIYVPVLRDPEIEKARLELPISGEEQTIMETIRYNDIVIISGETGSGKTTQIPQFLYEAGYALNGKIIGITEPRRVAAVSMSERVARELNLTSQEVSYQIRFSGTTTDSTLIKFMTDGVLLRECQQDFLLSKYSVLIIDEAHERSVFSDILIGLLSRIVPLRAKRGNPLKLVIMSATLKVSDFTENSFLFPQVPPIISIETRQFPVSVHFAKTTPANYLQAAYKKACSVHSKMPKGGILIFVASQMDVKVLCKKLRQKFRKKQESSQASSLTCLGLYALLPLDKQRLVFKDPPEGTRLCVVATNVAETSITIPNIKYVIDTGMEKSKVYDLTTGISKLITTWTSKSSAEQRTGRAGRMGPGHCFRLYSSAVFTNDLPDHADPHILRKPVEDVLLQMKSMNIDNVVNFPFPTRPSIEALKAAERKLALLGALDDSKFKTARYQDIDKTEFSSRPTALGMAMANYAVGARCSKMIVLSPPALLPHVIAMVSAITVREMFLEGNKWRAIKKKWSGQGNSKLLGDFMIMLRAIFAADSFECSNKRCLSKGLRTKTMLEIDKLRRQLTKEVNSNLKDSVVDDNQKLTKPTEAQCKLLRQLLVSSYCDHIARRLPDGEIVEKSTSDPNKTEKRKLKNAYECMEADGPVYIDSDSILKGEHHEFIIYKELYRGDKKMYMRDVAVIEPEWLPHYAHKLCQFGEQSNEKSSSPPKYDKLLDQIICNRPTTYGNLNWKLGSIDVPMHLVDSGAEIYKHFACALLAGEVIDWFKTYAGKLLSPPSIMTKPWSKLQPRTSKILQTLLANNVKSKKDLLATWKKDDTCKSQSTLSINN